MNNINKESLKDKAGVFLKFGVLFLLIIIFFGILAKDKKYNVSMSTLKDNIITVTGKSEKFIKPDTASFYFSISESSTDKKGTVKTVSDVVNKKVKKAVESLKKEGVEESDIKSTSYNVYPNYKYKDGEKILLGYKVTQRIKVKIKDIEKISKILSTVTNLNVSYISNLTFFLDNDKEVKEQLRAEAIENAKAEAKKISSQLGVKLNEIVGFSDSSSNNIEYYYPRDRMLKSSKIENDIAVVPTGKNKMNAEVKISYKIKN